MIAYGFLMLFLFDHFTGRRQRNGIVRGAAILIGAVELSRVYLGVHYMSDVMGWWIAGTAWLLACVIGYRFATARRGRALEAPR